MTWISRLFGNIPKREDQSQVIRTVYDDSNVEAQFESESIDNEYDDFASFVIQCCRGELQNTLDETSCYITKENGFRGIAINPLPSGPAILYQKYCKLLKAKHQELGYVVKMSEYIKKGQNETMKYYLKPSVKLQKGIRAEQLFGNVTIELKVKQGRARQLSAVTSYYNDVNFLEVRAFEEWINVVFLGEPFNL